MRRGATASRFAAPITCTWWLIAEAGRWFVDLHFQGGKYSLEGDIALRAMATILPHLNVDAGSKGEVSSAVQRIEDSAVQSIS